MNRYLLEYSQELQRTLFPLEREALSWNRQEEGTNTKRPTEPRPCEGFCDLALDKSGIGEMGKKIKTPEP
jgi:hypothetical protein